MSISIQDLAIEYLETRSEKSFINLYKRIYPNLKNFARTFLKQYNISDLEDRVEDILSKVFQKIIENINQYNRLWNFSTWVYAICKNELIMEKRQIFKYISLDEISSLTDNKIDRDTFLSKYALNKEDITEAFDIIEYNENKEYIKNLYNLALKEILMLPDIYKEILIDREIYGMKYEDLANKYNLPINTIKSRIRVGRSKIKTNIKKQTGEVFI